MIAAALDGAIGLIYDAALDPAQWEAALAALASLFGARICHFFGYDRALERLSFSCAGGDCDETLEALYADHYAAIDPRRVLLDATAPGAVLPCHRYFDDAFVARDETFQDFMLPHDLHYTAVTRLNPREGDVDLLFGVVRAPREGRFDTETCRLLRQRVVPHLARAARIHHKLLTERREKARLLDTIHALDWAALVIEHNGRIVGMNRAAERLLIAGDGVSAVAGRLVASRADDAVALARAVAGAATATVLTIRRAPPRNPFWLTAIPLGARAAGNIGHARPAVALFIAETRHEPPQDRFARAFGLTPAEARLACGLVAGKTLEVLAAEHGVARNTLRVQMQSVFRKTGAARQAELASILLGLPAVSPPASPG